jgi:hypothetical protein
MRVTRQALRARVEQLNKILNRPAEAYTTNEKGRILHANAGHFILEVNAPGDGWTRYTLAMMLESSGETNVSPCLNGQEMWAYLRGVFDVLNSGEYTPHHFAKVSNNNLAVSA